MEPPYPSPQDRSLLDRLVRHATRTPDKVAVRVLSDAGDERECLSYAELWSRVHHVAAGLRERTRPGDRVLLLLPTSADYVCAFLGCFAAGLCAVPAYPPESAAAHAQRVMAIARAARPRVVLTELRQREATAQRLRAEDLDLAVLALEDLAPSTTLPPTAAYEPSPDELALLQYTSGSTASPKGVMVTHANLVANQAAIAHAFGISSDDVIVSWLPLYHDMGLLGALLQALYAGCELVLLSPGQFVRAPLRWLQAITRYRGTVSGGPDFGYRMCIERIDPREHSRLDLRSWRLAFTGAEPIRASTLDAFAEQLAGAGFRRESLYACYGLAEATLLVTGAVRDRVPATRNFEPRELDQGWLVEQVEQVAEQPRSTRLVSCGRAMPAHQVYIADPASGAPLPAATIGEIWFTGPSVTLGYFEDVDATHETYVERAGVRYLRTGDLGALFDGELFVAGRQKDLIIVRGRNLFPQDVEQAVEQAIEVLQKGRVAAFADDIAGEESIVVAVEVSRAVQKLLREDALASAITEAVAEAHLEAPRRILLCKPGALPKTSSGKLQRRQARAAFHAGSLGVYAHYELGVRQGEHAAHSGTPVAPPPLSEGETRLAAIWSELLKVPAVAPDTSFFALGGNSVLAAQLLVRIAEAFAVDLPLAAVFEEPTLRGQWRKLDAARQHAPNGRHGTTAETSDAPLASDQLLPLSAAQHSLWLSAALEAEPAALHVAIAIDLRGALRVSALEASLAQLQRRHEALRTTFEMSDGKPVQRVHAELETPRVGWFDLRETTLATGVDAARRGFVERHVERAFDLQRGPLWKCELAGLEDDRQLLLLAAHHLLLDGHALRVLLEELVALYRAACGLTARQLAAAPRLHDVLRRLDAPSEQQRAAALQTALSRLVDAPEYAELPLDHSRPATPSRRAGRVRLPLTAAQVSALEQLARSRGLPRSVLLLSALAALLQRHTVAEAVRIGVPLSERDGSALARAVTPCVRTALLSVSVSARTRLTDLIERVQTELRCALSQSGLSLTALIAQLAPERVAGRAPLFDVAFNHQPSLTTALTDLPDVRVVGVDTFTGFTQFDLTLDVHEEHDGTLVCNFEYARDLFDESSVQRMAASYGSVLDMLCSAPEMRVGMLALLPASERASLALGHAYAPPSASEDALVPQLLAAVAKRAPRAIALCAGTEQLSYGELDERASQLARWLCAHGAGPETCVGIHVGRHGGALIAMFAAWKAGAAFAPLDPSYPAARLAHMVQAAGIQLIVSDAPEAAQLGTAQVLDLAAVPLLAPVLPERAPLPRSLAYVIFTSGSTGLPKPVAVEHAALARHCRAMEQLYRFDASVCALHGASLSFDASIEQWLVPALAGGRIVLRPDGGWSTQELLACVQREQITHLYPPTPLLVELAHEVLRTGTATDVVSCTVGGEAVARETLSLLTRAFPGLALYNGYGPTECVVTPLLWTRTEGALAAAYAPIGRAVGERHSYVLDEELNALPSGVAAELYVAGEGLARGYLGRPRETAERFLPDPFGRGGRLYRTGDRVRFGHDGTVHYLGRRDGQVKLRGHRIELGEVECTLLEEPRVREAAVLMQRMTTTATTALIAYVAGEELDPTQLRAALAARLPAYMLPAHIVLVPALPRTPNGKLDKSALPVPKSAVTEAGEAPQGPLERLIAELFEALLGASPVDRDADFFQLGGDSILALQLSSRARERGYALSPRQVLEQRSVRALADVLCLLPATQEEPELEQAQDRADIALTPIQHELFGAGLVERDHFNQSVLLYCDTELEPARLSAALERVVQRHPAFRLRFAPADETPRQWLEPSASCPLELATAHDAAQLRAHCERVQRGLHLTHGPVFRALLVRMPDGQRLLLCAHHLVIDAVSFRIVLEDLAGAYAALASDVTVELPAPTCSFGAWSAALQRYARSAQLQEARDHWQAALAEPTGAVRTDHAGRRGSLAEAGRAVTQLDRQWTQRLLREAPKAYGTRGAELLLAALARVLCDAMGDDAVWVELESHGRELPGPGPDATRCVGWFTATFPLRLTAGDTAQRIRSVKEALRTAQPHALAHGLLRELCGELSAAPRPGLTFNYLGQLDASLERTGMRLSDEDRGLDCAASTPLRSGLNVDGQVQDGELRFVWTYDRGRYNDSEVQALAQGYARELQDLAIHCAGNVRRAVTPSDFPLSRASAADLDALPVEPQLLEDVFALTPMQQGMLAHALQTELLDPYLVRRGFLLRGQLDLPAFRQAWTSVVARHAALRSRYVWEGLSAPLQLVLSSGATAPRVEWCDLRCDLSAQTTLRTRAASPCDFALATADAGVLELARVGEHEHWLFWTHHHIALDGWSMGSIFADLLASYRMLRGDAGSSERTPTLQTAGSDVRAWRAAQLDSSLHERALLEQLAGFTQPTPLPQLESPLTAASADLPWAERTEHLPPELLTTLRVGAADAGVTVNVLLQAAYALLLGRHAATHDIVFGVTLSGRSALGPAAFAAAGLFINTLPLRVRLRPEQRVQDFLRAVQRTALGLQEHEHASLAALTRACALPQGTPLFESVLVFENYPIDRALRAGGDAHNALSIALLDAPTAEQHVRYVRGRNHFPLSLVARVEDGLELVFSYRRDRFSDADVALLATQLRSLLCALAEHPERKLTELRCEPSVSAPQTRAGALGTSVLEAFAAQVARVPAQIAARDEHSELSYRALAGLAHAVSTALTPWLQEAEPRVAVVLPRSTELCAALLGVLHAGAVYVPFEPDTPLARLQALLNDAGCRGIITVAERATALEPLHLPLLCIDTLTQGAAELAPASWQPQHAAYMIYTSGSTGTPKAVTISHGAIAHYVTALLSRLELEPGASMAWCSSSAADLGHTVLFGALCSGRTLHVIDHATATDAQAFADTMSRHRVGVLKIVPSHLRALLDGDAPERVLPRHALIVGGEASDAQLVAAVRAARPELRVINHYGPTETTVGVLTFELDEGGLSLAQLPTGTPLPGVYVRVLDTELGLVPEGAAGELFIGGPSLARGYHGRAAATAERFLPDPFCAGARIYRSGDRVRVRDGQIHFLGRIDEQLKVRGYRVEPAEVAAALRGCPGVQDAAVLVQRDPSAPPRLVAYYARSRSARGADADALGRELALRLPAHMIPELVELAELPRTHNGKLDRQRLVAPQQHAQDVKEADEPRGPVERKLAEIFCQVLAVPRVSRHASFAELGGDSILSLRVIARARKAGLPVTLQQLVRSESLAALAACIEPAARPPRPEPTAVTLPLLAAGAEQQEHPLSYEQERLWFLWKLEPQSSVYNIAAALRLTGELDPNALARSFARLVARHEALRTAFVERDGQPLAVVQPIASAAGASGGPHLHLETSPTLPAANAALDAWAREPFDLAAGQPLRWRLIRLSPTDHVLGIALHHAVADGWSLNLLMSELPRVYAAERHAQPVSLPPLTLNYGQYATWQRAVLSGERRQRLLDYWQQQLGSEHAPIELPFDRPRRAARAHARGERRAGASELLRLDPEVISRARSLAHLERTSLFSVLLTCLDVLLARDSGQRDVRVGLGMANRPRVDSEDVVGFFVQTLVHRARLSDRVSFRALLAQVSDTLLAAQEHADLPFSQLVAALSPERSDSHDPLVQVFYNHQKRASGALDLPDLRVERLELPTTTAQFELGLYTEEDDHGALQGRFVYATRLFDASSAARLARRFERLLHELVAAPDLAVDDAACSGAEDARLLAHVNATAQDYTKSPLVPTRIGTRLRELGSRPALCFGDEELSGLELNARANLLAQRLRASGVGPDVLVGVCLARSLELVVAVLGVLKAGGAYLPLEPELPDERLSQMLQLAGPRVVLTTSIDAPRFATWNSQPTRTARTLLAVDRQPYDAELARAELSEPALHGENLAYVIFTSGSTGRPKAVASRHAGLLNRLQWMQSAYALDETDVVLHKTPFGFDVSVWELLWPLLQGARLVVAAPSAHKDPLALTQTITQQAVTTLHFVPSMLAAFLEHPSTAQCRSLRRIVCSGEALPPAVATRTLEQLPAAALYNLYGPTEASIDVTHWTCCAHDEVVPIGAPIANTSVHVLDAQLAPVPIGVAGELYLAGVGLARGYHAAPGLTAERFVPHPTMPGARMYRTGDRVRLRTDGALEYLGRNDGQIKLRGVRIELGEIEAALSACPGVRRAAVALHAGAHLVGYVVGEGLEPTQLRTQLARALPDAYVPTQIVVLPELPLTHSGKLDRKALPAPALEPTCFIEPEPGLQSQIALLWAELLQVERVGRDDDFFALGGHSLLAARLLARLEGELGVQVPLQRLFTATRLSAFAALVEETRTQSSGATQRMAAWLDELETE